RPEDAPPSHEGSEDGAFEFAALRDAVGAGRELLHHHRTQEGEWQRVCEKLQKRRFLCWVANGVDVDVGVERVFHARRRIPKRSSMPPTPRIAALPSAISRRNATKSRARSMASVSVATPSARRAASSFRWSIATFFRTQPVRLARVPWGLRTTR